VPQPTRLEIETHLQKLCASNALGGDSTNWSKFLRFLTNCVLDKRIDLMTERAIGELALGRRPGYDIQRDRIVSVVKNRLRNEKLPAYYAAEGQQAQLRFHLPSKGFQLEIEVLPQQVPLEMRFAYHAALRAYDDRQAVSLMQAMARLDALLELAPSHGPSWALLAEICIVAANLIADPRNLMPKARLAAERALALDSRLWRAHLAIAVAAGSMDADWTTAGSRAAEALRLGGSQVACNHLYSAVLVALGQPQAAVSTFEEALFGEPELARFRVLRADLALITWIAGDLDRTELLVADLLAEDPRNFLYHGNLAILRVAQQRYDEAVSAFERSTELLGVPFLPGWHAYAIGKAGDPARAREIAANTKFVHSHQHAAAWLGAAEPDLALNAIEEGVTTSGEPFLMWTGLTPFHRDLHGHPRFEAILDRYRFRRARFV